MTGLDETQDHILEVAAVVTDVDFKVLGQYEAIVYQPQSVIDNMNDWCKNQHGASGLTAKIPQGTPLEKVEQELITFAQRFFKSKDRIVLCGNSVGNDRRFIDYHMKAFASRLHYRLIDVSSFKEIFRDKYAFTFEKANKHRAIDDILESIQELQAYLSCVDVEKIKLIKKTQNNPSQNNPQGTSL
jgi:oligoribonuclease